MTGVVPKYMREHTMENEIWDEGQLGAVEGVLDTADQLIIDWCIMEEVKQYHRNLAITFYDYKKVYDKVHHDWMLSVPMDRYPRWSDQTDLKPNEVVED